MTGPLPSDDYLARIRHAENLIIEARRVHAAMPEAERVAKTDQLTAAAKEVRSNLEAVAVDPEQIHYGNKERQMTLLLAGIVGTRRCRHLEEMPAQPATLAMSTRVQLCQRCLAKTRNPFRRPPVVVHDHQCDLCLGEPVEHFNTITVQIGPVLMGGAICDPCMERLNE